MPINWQLSRKRVSPLVRTLYLVMERCVKSKGSLPTHHVSSSNTWFTAALLISWSPNFLISMHTFRGAGSGDKSGDRPGPFCPLLSGLLCSNHIHTSGDYCWQLILKEINIESDGRPMDMLSTIWKIAIKGLNLGEIKNKLKANYVEILLTNWKIWPAAQLLNFYFVPLQHRLLVSIGNVEAHF